MNVASQDPAAKSPCIQLLIGGDFTRAVDVSQDKNGKRDLKSYPANAVCDRVLDLLSQVGSNRETPPWLRPIALFPRR